MQKDYLQCKLCCILVPPLANNYFLQMIRLNSNLFSQEHFTGPTFLNGRFRSLDFMILFLFSGLRCLYCITRVHTIDILKHNDSIIIAFWSFGKIIVIVSNDRNSSCIKLFCKIVHKVERLGNFYCAWVLHRYIALYALIWLLYALH